MSLTTVPHLLRRRPKSLRLTWPPFFGGIESKGGQSRLRVKSKQRQAKYKSKPSK